MQRGVLSILTACLVWGLIFVVPSSLPNYSTFEIALGRCFFFGIVSVYVFLFHKKKVLISLSKEIWVAGILLALLGNLIHYFALVMAMRYTSPAFITLVLGSTPVCIALCGNVKTRERSFSSLLISCLVISLGLFLINVSGLNEHVVIADLFFGLCWSLIALVTWVWYMIATAEFLKKEYTLRPSDWITVLGVSTFFWSLIVTFPFIFSSSAWSFSPTLPHFLIGTCILGVCSSWLGSYFWNLGASKLPLTLAGQLCIFETIFGLLFVYLVEKKIPSTFQWTGIFLIFFGLVLNFYFKSTKGRIF